MVHDWKILDPGMFHSFQMGWVCYLSEQLNKLDSHEFYATLQRRYDKEQTLSEKHDEAVFYSRIQNRIIFKSIREKRDIGIFQILSTGFKHSKEEMDIFGREVQKYLKRGINFGLVDIFVRDNEPSGGLLKTLFKELSIKNEIEVQKQCMTVMFTREDFIEASIQQFDRSEVIPDLQFLLNNRRVISINLQEAYNLAIPGFPKHFMKILNSEK